MSNRSRILRVFLVGAILAGAGALVAASAESINQFQTYLVRWWGTEGSIRTRPTYRVARIDNGKTQLHYSIVPGRPLGNFILPYWPIRSGFSIINAPAELAHNCRAAFTLKGEHQEIGFVPRSGCELASLDGSDVLKIRNRSVASPEDATTGGPESNPLMMEHVFVIPKGSPTIQVLVRITNTGEETLQDAACEVNYEQNFNWGRFGAYDGREYQPVSAPVSGKSTAFYAFSSGMGRGYEVVAGDNSTLTYTLTTERNAWDVALSARKADLNPGESAHFAYALHVLENSPVRPVKHNSLSEETLQQLRFRRVQPTEYKKAPIQTEGRVTLAGAVHNLERPKMRGVNLRDGFPRILESLETLKAWGCNQIIISIGEPGQTAQVIEKGHALGMEVFLAGAGSYHDGAPSFDTFYQQSLSPAQIPDSHGQDEDHYYWDSIRPTRDFEADFGKPMIEATAEEKVQYWADCFVEKWEGVLSRVRRYAPDGGIWFYKPSPTIAHVDPLDYQDVFFQRIARLGERLTVFPFYYGVEYNQAEYMVRRWKDAGLERVIFLPMTDFMVRPSQFMRAITAARRGQADGMCGFNFPVLDEAPGKEWQWKSILLAAQANFPTPELDAFCFIEEPAELLERLAVSDVLVSTGGRKAQAFVERLAKLLPGKVTIAANPTEPAGESRLTVTLGDDASLRVGNWAYRVPESLHSDSKGLIQMREGTVSLSGASDKGLENAIALFLRFAELSRAERGE